MKIPAGFRPQFREPKPRWNCRDKKDQQRLEQWTLAQLERWDDHFVDPSLSWLRTRVAQLFKRGLVKAADYKLLLCELHHLKGRGVQHVGEVKLAALREEFGPPRSSATEWQKRAHHLFYEITAMIPDNELRNVAFAAVFKGLQPSQRRRKKRKRALTERKQLAELDIKRIRCIWKAAYNKSNRSTPTATEIAARLWGVTTAAQLGWQRSHRYSER